MNDGTNVPKGGIFRDMPWQVYGAIPAINWGLLSPFRKSPAHALEDQRMGRTSPALEFGGALHRAILEPALFEQEYIVAPHYDLRTKAGKEAKAFDLAAIAGKNITYIDADDMEIIRRMSESVYKNPRASAMLSDPTAMKEVSVVWLDPENGMYFKARIDLLSRFGGYSWVIDLKSARDAGPFAFRRDVANFGYHGQVAHYMAGLNTLKPYERKAGFIVVEKTAPWSAVVYELDVDAVNQGDQERRSYIAQLIECRTSNVWPSYPDGMLSLPPWAFKPVQGGP